MVLPNNERLLTLSGKLEIKVGNFIVYYIIIIKRARELFTKAKELCGGVKSWSTLIKFEILNQDLVKASELADLAC